MTKVRAHNNGELEAEKLFVLLAAEVVGRDRVIAEAGKVCSERIAANLDMDSRRREVALRAENAELRDALRALVDAHYAYVDEAQQVEAERLYAAAIAAKKLIS